MSVRREDSLTVGEDQDSVSFWFVVLLTLPAFALLAVLSLRYDTPQSACILGDPPLLRLVSMPCRRGCLNRNETLNAATARTSELGADSTCAYSRSILHHHHPDNVDAR